MFLLIEAIFAVAPTAAQEKPLTTQEQKVQKTLFAWLDTTLSLPDLKNTSIVRVINHAWSPWDIGIRTGLLPYKIEYGFLLKEDKKSFTVFFTSSLKLTVKRTNDPASARYEKMDEKTFLKQWFKPFTGSEHIRSYHSLVYFDNHEWTRPVSEGGRSDIIDALFFARFYAARGDMQTANRFYQYSLKGSYAGTGLHSVEELPGRFYDILQFHIEHLFYDPYLTRPNLLNLVRLLDSKPFSNVSPETKKQADEWQSVLIQMIEEDKQHTLHPPPPLEKLPIKERVAQLIFRLRDSLIQSPYASNSFYTLTPYEKSLNSNPLYHSDSALVKIGYPAVQQLIEAFGDKRFTRSGRTIGEKAKQIFSEITGYGFNDLHQAHKREVSDFRKAALAWWAEFQQKGEKQLLVERTILGDGDSLGFAEHLVKKYPNESLLPIIQGYKRAGNQYVKKNLLELVVNRTDKEAQQFVRSVLWSDAEIEIRTLAVKAQLEQGELEAINALISIWNNPSIDDFEMRQLIRLLCSTRHPDVLLALRNSIPKVSSYNLIVTMIYLFAEAHAFPPSHPNIAAEQRRVKSDFEQNVEEFLLQCLTRFEGVSIEITPYWNNRKSTSSVSPLSRRRACDVAGVLLAFMRPDKYQFDIDTSLRQRDIQRVKILNQQRKEQNLPPFPIPTLPTQKQPKHTIAQVHISEDTPPLPETLRQKIMALQGTAPSANQLSVHLNEIVQDTPSSIRTLYIVVESAGDGTGLRLFFQFEVNDRYITTKSKGVEITLLSGIKILNSDGENYTTKAIPHVVVQNLIHAYILPENKPFELMIRFRQP
jgi:hypothetical protein